MGTYTVTGNDTFVMGDRVFNDFVDGDTITITFPNEAASSTTGKGGNSIVADNTAGDNADIELSLSVGSSDDIFLNAQYNTYKSDPAAYTLMNGRFVKRVGDGSGTVNSIVYDFEGVFVRQGVDARENVSGDTEQGKSVFRVRALRAKRTIQ